MSENIIFKDSKGNVYEQVACVEFEECATCSLDDTISECLAAPCRRGKNWKLIGEKIPDIAETLWAAIRACAGVRGAVCECVAFPCRYWITKNCPSRKHLAALGDENAWRAK